MANCIWFIVTCCVFWPTNGYVMTFASGNHLFGIYRCFDILFRQKSEKIYNKMINSLKGDLPAFSWGMLKQPLLNLLVLPLLVFQKIRRRKVYSKKIIRKIDWISLIIGTQLLNGGGWRCGVPAEQKGQIIKGRRHYRWWHLGIVRLTTPCLTFKH